FLDRLSKRRAHQGRRPCRRANRRCGSYHRDGDTRSPAVIVGQSVRRKEGRDKVTGGAIYVDDWTLPRMLHGATIRTPCARGRIRGISFAPHIPWDEFVIVTAKDIPGRNVVALIGDDQPYLASESF